jgi:hypothetical protein
MEIPYATSLKDKRSVVNRLRDRLRRKFNISISEIDDLDDCNNATLGVVMAASDIPYLNGALDKLIEVLHEDRDASLADHQMEILSPQ